MKFTESARNAANSDIIRIEGQSRAYGAGNMILVGLTIFSAVKVHRYLCTECGFSEE